MRWLVGLVLIVGIAQAETKNTPVAVPTISPPPGIYGEKLSVTLADSTPNAAIHYTLDGSKPNENSPVYTGQILIRSSTKVRAIATVSGYLPSTEFAGSYEIENLSKLLGAG
ncbi:MAG TPA: chitobiase/beta-hexosaminidase C-terminal domain-containing protein [Terriglobales bacterium]|jgi:hypothetical protein